MSSSIPIFLVILLAPVGKRSNSRSQMFSKTGVLKIFAIFTGKSLCWSLFLIKFQDWRPTFLFKKRRERRCFSVDIAKFLRAAILLKTCSLYLFEIFIWWQIIDSLELYFTIVKLGHENSKNFAIDRSKLVFRYLNISLLQRFVSSSNCKEKLVALNWTILVSNFSKYIVQKQSPGRVLLKSCS